MLLDTYVLIMRSQESAFSGIRLLTSLERLPSVTMGVTFVSVLRQMRVSSTRWPLRIGMLPSS